MYVLHIFIYTHMNIDIRNEPLIQTHAIIYDVVQYDITVTRNDCERMIRRTKTQTFIWPFINTIRFTIRF